MCVAKEDSIGFRGISPGLANQMHEKMENKI